VPIGGSKATGNDDDDDDDDVAVEAVLKLILRRDGNLQVRILSAFGFDASRAKYSVI
jgi:hypothetical protein